MRAPASSRAAAVTRMAPNVSTANIVFTALSYRRMSPAGMVSVNVRGARLACRSSRWNVTFTAAVLGLCTHTVVYHTAGGTPGFAPTDGRKRSVPEKPARAADAARVRVKSSVGRRDN